MILYLNPNLRVGLQTIPGSATVKITFPEGRETYLFPPDSPNRHLAKNECPLGSLNAEERKRLSQAVRTLRPGTEASLPWASPAESTVPTTPALTTSRSVEPVQLGDRFALGLTEAHRLHREQRRKGTAIPYVSHLLAVTALVLEHGGDEDQAIAALLHDAIEDASEQAGGPEALRARIAQHFGPRVLDLVEHCTDTDSTPKPAWRERKEARLRRLAEAPPEALLIVASDKLHNTRTLIADLARHGADVWGRFHGGRDGTLWYLNRVLFSVRQKLGGPIVETLHCALADLHDADDRVRALHEARQLRCP